MFRSLATTTLRRAAAGRPSTNYAIHCRLLSSEPIVPGIGKGKTSTGYVGLAVEADWYNIMIQKFQGLLDRLEASEIPETAQYRIDVTKWANFVLKTAQEHPDDPEAVEDAVRMGQVEELIEMADDENVAMSAFIDARLWEYIEETAVDFDPDPTKDPFAKGENQDVAESLRKGMEGEEKK